MLSSVAAGAAEVAAATAAPNEKPPVEKPMLGAAGVEELDVEPNEKPPDKAESVLGCEVPKENGAVEATDSAGFDAGADDPKLNKEAGAGADVLISVGFSGIVDEVGFTMPNETDFYNIYVPYLVLTPYFLKLVGIQTWKSLSRSWKITKSSSNRDKQLLINRVRNLVPFFLEKITLLL